MAPRNSLLKRKRQVIHWTPEDEVVFVDIKKGLVSAPILCSPDFDFTIACDASHLGGYIFQEIDGQERVISFASHSLSREERKIGSLNENF